MTDIMASVFVDVQQSNAKETTLRDGNCIVNASTVSWYSLQRMMLRVVADGSKEQLWNALYDRRIARFDIAFPGSLGETNPNMT